MVMVCFERYTLLVKFYIQTLFVSVVMIVFKMFFI